MTLESEGWRFSQLAGCVEREQARDENADPFTNTIKVTIAQLRRKLGQPDIIHTIPAPGYRITKAP